MQCITQSHRGKRASCLHVLYGENDSVRACWTFHFKTIGINWELTSLCCYKEDLNMLDMAVMGCYHSDSSISEVWHCCWVLGVWFTVAIQFTSKVFSGVQVWTLCWPVHRLFKSFLYGSCFAHMAIVVLGKKKNFPNCSNKKVDCTQFFSMSSCCSIMISLLLKKKKD